MAKFGNRLKHAWNAFTDSDEVRGRPIPIEERGSYISSSGPERRIRMSNERSIISSIYARIGIDVAGIPMRHVRTDEDGRYLSDIVSGLDECLRVGANLDQEARQFRQDIAMTVVEEGVAAIVPVDTTLSPEESGGYDIKS